MKRGLIIGAVVVLLVAFAGGAFLALRRLPSTSPGAVPAAAPPAPPQAATTPAAPADCLLPGPPPVAPDGRVATAQDMSLGHDAARNFVLQLEAYQACRNAQADHAPPGTTDKQKDAWIDQGNQAVDEANAIKDAFGQQLAIFKSRQAPAPAK
jgi:hypothetical protein